ncbi:hypothetical protein GIB67_023300, partial [Kingdonia uniflora]
YTSIKPLADRVLLKSKPQKRKPQVEFCFLQQPRQSHKLEDDIVGILETEDIKDLKPLNDRILIKVTEAETKTAGGLLLTEATKEKQSVGTVIAVGPGSVDEEGKKKPLTVAAGNTVLYSKYAGNDFKGTDGTEYIALRESDILAVLS